MLFKKNYLKPSKEDIEQLKIAQDYKRNNFIDNEITLKSLEKYHDLMPQYGYHIESLFPNNYLLFNYRKHPDILEKCFDFYSLINAKKTNEQQVLNFIKNNEAYFILESLFWYYSFGHHDSYLFKEFPLPPDYLCDYLLIGKNSCGYEFVFIEFESPSEKSTLSNGEFSQSLRKGIKQTKDWESWIESNFHLLQNVFKKHKNPNLKLPDEFYNLDKTRIHFLVVGGRRKHFDEKSYRNKRKSRNSFKVIHYDNIIDTLEIYVNNMPVKKVYKSFKNLKRNLDSASSADDR